MRSASPVSWFQVEALDDFHGLVGLDSLNYSELVVDDDSPAGVKSNAFL